MDKKMDKKPDKKNIVLLGSTGSIGRQALEVIRSLPDRFRVKTLTGWHNSALLVEQAREFQPKTVVIGDKKRYQEIKDALKDLPVEVLAGEEALSEVASREGTDLVLAAIVGFAGLKSVLAALEQGIPVALANKETLVVAGDLVMETARRRQVPIIPVDSEHSAIFQCLQGEADGVEKIILTASGGPFIGKKTNFLVNVKRDHALQHPNWKMGEKISIDSATLMNKGLEMIEARWLFDLTPDQIEVVIHPQSVIHSVVQFVDGSLKAQMGLPDMRVPIQYALTYPRRIANTFPRFSFKDYPKLTFDRPDLKTFRNLALAMDALHKGGSVPCVLNAANEETVYAFLRNKIGFLDMTEIIEEVLNVIPVVEKPTLADYQQSDRSARELAQGMIRKKSD
ncbi:MAG TPA: 1-deoxy-D-xylulose-5-phosphate reductoisomerase [Chitinophagaceae bacterium]|nr:1-deoxy-D-xylulose-5-phosphate reductoisomerase [Chitinophagaceae bacterium]